MDESEERGASPKAGDEASFAATEGTLPTSDSGARRPAELESPDDDERDTIPVSRRSIRPAASELVHPALATEGRSHPAPAIAVDESPVVGSAAEPAMAIAEPAAELVEPVPVTAAAEPAAPEAASEEPAAAVAREEASATVASEVSPEPPAVREEASATVASEVSPEPPAVREEASATVASEVSPPLVVAAEPDAALAPVPETTSSVAANAVEVADASSMSAQVVPIRPGAGLRVARGESKLGVQKSRAKAEPTSSRSSLWMLAGAAALAALWLSSRGGDTEHGKVPLSEEPAAASEPAAVGPAEHPEPTPALDSSVEPSAERSDATPVLLAQTKPAEADAPERMQPASKLVVHEAEPARLTAYKAVMLASQEARNCRHRGDVAGKIPIVVEFGSDGRVQRTQAKGTFANPMTNRCIVSKFSALSVAGPVPAPIIVTANVTLR
jgi:hypothetical protein